MSYANGPKIVTDGLVLCLDAANRKSYPGSGSTWYDLSGNGNNGTLTNGPTFSSTNGGSIVFDGTNDYVPITDNSSISSIGDADFSLSAFIKPNSSSLNKNIFRRDNFQNQGTENRKIIAFNISLAGFLYFYTWDGNGNTSVYSQNICDGKWHYVVAVYDSSSNTQYIYENGILRAQAVYNNTQSFNTTRSPWCIGNVNTVYNAEWYTGGISQALIYNRLLSADEVRRNYDALKGRYGLT